MNKSVTEAFVVHLIGIAKLSPIWNLASLYITKTLVNPVSIDTMVAVMFNPSKISPTFKFNTEFKINESNTGAAEFPDSTFVVSRIL